MTQLIKLVIGALVALDLTAAPFSPRLTLRARYVGNDRSIVSLDCYIGGPRFLQGNLCKILKTGRTDSVLAHELGPEC